MPNNILKGLSVITLVIFLVGCSSTTRNVQVRSYKQDKKRIDQELGGALGNWENSVNVVTDEDRKETRKMYVLEFTKNPEPMDFDIEEVEEDTTRYQAESDSYEIKRTTTRRRIQKTPKINLPSFDEEDEDWLAEAEYDDGPRKASTFVEYTVEKNDTLQKISKRFYNSYSKWPRIYDANKKVLKDPNDISPGLVIRVPVE